ncbi:AMP-binding protein [Nocardioides sp. 616]|uniref:AMP-binding protein n=1 Tax=Nocardioides sp. 616 TaxID=2268090 RepID=UPI000CE3070E|nr:AMP-binding protein [Nocardioides sp. 616]
MGGPVDIFDAPAYWSRFTPEAVAVRDDDGDLSWTLLVRGAEAGAAVLAARGVQPGDRVGLLMLNSRQFCVSALAVLAAGAVLVPINFRLHPREMAEQLLDAGAQLLLHDPHHVEQAAAVRGRCSVETLVPDEVQAPPAADAVRARTVRDFSDVAVILYSSGTTGRPKGVVITHQSIYAMAHDRIVNDAWSRDTRTYVPYPLAFSAGLLASWMATMVAGGMTVVDAAFDPGRALRRFEEDGITVFMSVPALWQAIVNHPDIDKTRVDTLSTVSAGGAMVTPELMARLRSHGILLSQGYGLTESSGVATALRPEDIDRKPGSIGRPMMRMEAKVVDPMGVECPVGESGELWLRGPAVMAGYWRNGAPDPATLHDGWLATGDIATQDEDGFLYIVDRLKDMIITGGINVFPAEIERVLEDVPGVLECSVVGAPHEKWGETPIAFVVTADETLTPELIESRLRVQLAGYKVPSQILVRTASLPRSANGKILRRELRREVADAPGAAPPADAPSAEGHRALVTKYFDAVNTRDWTTLASVLHPEVTIRHGDLMSASGVDQVVKLYQAILLQYREGGHEDRPTRILVQGDLVAVEITATVVKLDGTRLTFPAADFIDVQDGLLKSISTWYDTAAVVPMIKGQN